MISETSDFNPHAGLHAIGDTSSEVTARCEEINEHQREATAARDYQRNRQETLQLCDAFQAFYAANAAYQLDL